MIVEFAKSQKAPVPVIPAKAGIQGNNHFWTPAFEGVTASWIEVERLVGMPTNDEIVKNAFCQGKSGFRKLIGVNDCGLEKGQVFVIFASTSDSRFRA